MARNKVESNDFTEDQISEINLDETVSELEDSIDESDKYDGYQKKSEHFMLATTAQEQEEDIHEPKIEVLKDSPPAPTSVPDSPPPPSVPDVPPPQPSDPHPPPPQNCLSQLPIPYWVKVMIYQIFGPEIIRHLCMEKSNFILV